MHALRIWLAVLFMTVAYGVVHDQFTIRLSPEYFLVGHVRVLATEALTPVALFWGVASSVPGGLALAFLTTSAARFGRTRPPLELSDLLPWILGLPLVAFAAAGAACLLGFALYQLEVISFPQELAASVERGARGRFMAAWAAHLTTYAAFGVGGLGMALHAWRRRGQDAHT